MDAPLQVLIKEYEEIVAEREIQLGNDIKCPICGEERDEELVSCPNGHLYHKSCLRKHIITQMIHVLNDVKQRQLLTSVN